MNAAYLFRLACLCLASFFLVNSVLAAMTCLLAGAAIRTAETMRPRSAARFLFTLRMLPSVLAVTIVLGFCVPSYFWLEPHRASERLGFACLLLAALGAVACSRSLSRTARAIRASARLSEEWRSVNETSAARQESQAVVVEKKEPLLALVGVFHPQVIISRGVLTELSKEQLDLAVRHEKSHRVSRDNLKRLFLVLSPEFFPSASAFASLEKTWAKLSEWAADDEAVQGDSQRALSLAAALLRVARMGAQPRRSILHTSLLPEDHDLSARVHRLLRVEPLPVQQTPGSRASVIVGGLGFLVCALTGMPTILSSVHRLLELFFR